MPQLFLSDLDTCTFSVNDTAKMTNGVRVNFTFSAATFRYSLKRQAHGVGGHAMAKYATGGTPGMLLSKVIAANGNEKRGGFDLGPDFQPVQHIECSLFRKCDQPLSDLTIHRRFEHNELIDIDKRPVEINVLNIQARHLSYPGETICNEGQQRQIPDVYRVSSSGRKPDIFQHLHKRFRVHRPLSGVSAEFLFPKVGSGRLVDQIPFHTPAKEYFERGFDTFNRGRRQAPTLRRSARIVDVFPLPTPEHYKVSINVSWRYLRQFIAVDVLAEQAKTLLINVKRRLGKALSFSGSKEHEKTIVNSQHKRVQFVFDVFKHNPRLRQVTIPMIIAKGTSNVREGIVNGMQNMTRVMVRMKGNKPYGSYHVSVSPDGSKQ
jgi:hypothetical protein